MPIRVKEAADILQVSKGTVRNWCADGKLPYSLSAAGQKVFDRDELIRFKNKQLGIEEAPPRKLFYVRSSNKTDVTVEAQINKLEEAYGTPDKVFKDFASGLNENRKGLKQLLTEVEKDSNSKVVYVTNKDRLTRFGFSYLEQLLEKCNCEVIVLDADDTKEPHEVLMQDFMSLLASFSGKFYRLRGWEQRKKFLRDVTEEVENHEKAK